MKLRQSVFAFAIVLPIVVGCGSDVVATDTRPGLALSVEPMRAVGGQAITVWAPTPTDGCIAASTCAVTIGGFATELASDVGAIVAVVGMNQQGDVCLTLDGATACVSGFEQLQSPRIDRGRFVRRRCSPSTLEIQGEGCPLDASITLDGVEALSWVGDGGFISAQLADDMSGEKTLVVSAPSHRRCGAPSEPIQVVIH